MKTFFHRADLDGHCSGAIIKHKNPYCKMVGVDYGDILDKESIEKNETVFVVDFCFPLEDMIWLYLNADLIFIDHHKTSMDMLESIPIAGKREIGKAACELTWEFLYPDMIHPWSVFALGAYDTWRFSSEIAADQDFMGILPFQYGMRAQADTGPENLQLWKDVLEHNNKVLDIIKHGRVILDYEKTQNTKFAAMMAYETTFEGLNIIAMNKPFANSMVFDSVYDPEKHDAMMLITAKSPDDYKYSLYSTKPEIDVSEIAKKYGGGGHKGAAGFLSDRRVA